MKNGFTLIELLAVIVILAIIALIATPIVLGIINDSKNSATIRSAGYYIEAVKHAIMKKNLELQVPIDPKECTVISNSYIRCDNVELLVEVEGELPDSGNITFESGKTITVNLTYGDRTVIKNSNGELVLDGTGEHKLAPGLYDENDVLVASWDELIDAGLDVSSYEKYENNATIFESYGGYKLVISDSVTEIGGYVFAESRLTSVIISNSVTSIGDEAFWDSQLASVVISNSVTYIGNLAFAANQLTSVVIPDSVISIGDDAFSANQLTSVTIPDSVTSIGTYAFYANPNLTTINYKGTEEEWTAIEFGDYWDEGTPENKVINYNYTG